MKTIEYKWDRNRLIRGWMPASQWPPGPWDDEPDKIQFQHEATGLPCLILRNGGGALCGYVGVTREHPLYGVDYTEPDIEVHGGLTFAGRCGGGPDAEQMGICHVPGEGEADDIWWLGFDCAHCYDLSPGMASLGLAHGEVYRDISYVRGEIDSLARQLSIYEESRQ